MTLSAQTDVTVAGAAAGETARGGIRVAPIERPTLHNTVVGRIRDLIIEGRLAPGERIHEGQLGLQLGVSRTPLREALKVLASEGLVDLVPSRGALVRSLTPKSVKDMLLVLATLEDMAGRHACAHASPEGIAGVRRLHDEMLGFYAAGDTLNYFKHNQRIHSAIVALSGNESLVLMQGMLQSQMKRIRFLGNRNAQTWAAAVADHEEMIAALEARDGDRLARALSEHLARTWDRVQHAI